MRKNSGKKSVKKQNTFDPINPRKVILLLKKKANEGSIKILISRYRYGYQQPI